MGNGKRVLDYDLACEIGVKEAIIFNQMHYWMGKKPHLREGKYWVYNSFSEWHKQLAFYSFSAIQTGIYKLTELSLISSGNYCKNKSDKTRWYTINYDHPILAQYGIKASPRKKVITTLEKGDGSPRRKATHHLGSSRSIHKNTNKIAAIDYYKLSRESIGEFSALIGNSKVLDAFNRLHQLQQFETRRGILNQICDRDDPPLDPQGFISKCVDRCIKGEFKGFTMPTLEYCKRRYGEE